MKIERRKIQGDRGRVVLNEDVERGGVLIQVIISFLMSIFENDDFGQTWRQDEDTVLSNLTLHRAGPGDKGFRHHHYHHLINIIHIIQHQHHTSTAI